MRKSGSKDGHVLSLFLQPPAGLADVKVCLSTRPVKVAPTPQVLARGWFRLFQGHRSLRLLVSVMTDNRGSQVWLLGTLEDRGLHDRLLDQMYPGSFCFPLEFYHKIDFLLFCLVLFFFFFFFS